MRRVEAFASIPASSKPARPDGPETAEEGFLREGMTNAEGLEALDRILACNVSPQVAASTLDLDLWLDRLDHGGRGTPAEDANWSIGTPGLVRPGGDAGVRAPRDAIERDLAAIWKEMLGVQQVSIDDDFFELGGQSLIAMRLFNRIRKEHGVELPLSVLFQAPTIAATAALLREAKGLAAIDPSADAVDVVHASERRRSALGGSARRQPPIMWPANFPSQRTHNHQAFRRPPDRWSRSHGAAIDRRCSASMAPGATCSTSATSRGVCTMISHFSRCRRVAWMARPNLHRSIEEMARAYVEEIRALRPQRPLFSGRLFRRRRRRLRDGATAESAGRRGPASRVLRHVPPSDADPRRILGP